MTTDSHRRGRRLALASIAANCALAAITAAVGVWSGSTSVIAVGAEFAGDVLVSSAVFVGFVVGARPPDRNHPYGHGRLETVAGLLVGFILAVAGTAICYSSLTEIGMAHPPPALSAVFMLLVAIGVRLFMSARKFRAAREIGSVSLAADAWNDAIDVLGAAAALTAVLLARFDSQRFLSADHYGGFAVGLVVIVTALRVIRDASLDLADTMPAPVLLDAVRTVATSVGGVHAVETLRARKTGLRYHLDLHIEVDPDMTVRESHGLAHDVKARIQTELPWVADVLVHVEPADGVDRADETVRSEVVGR